MSDRYKLHDSLGRLQAILAKAERRLPLDQPVRPGPMYEKAIAQIDALTDEFTDVLRSIQS